MAIPVHIRHLHARGVMARQSDPFAGAGGHPHVFLDVPQSLAVRTIPADMARSGNDEIEVAVTVQVCRYDATASVFVYSEVQRNDSWFDSCGLVPGHDG
jgi:hypothetical protein